jgi:hypothetical protein
VGQEASKGMVVAWPHTLILPPIRMLTLWARLLSMRDTCGMNVQAQWQLVCHSLL